MTGSLPPAPAELAVGANPRSGGVNQFGSSPAAGVRQEFPPRGLSLRRITGYAVAATLFLFVNKLGIVGNAIFFLGVAVLLSRSPLSAVMGFSLAVLALTANTAFVAKSVVFTFSRVFSVGLFSARFALGGPAGWAGSPPYLTISLFCLLAAVCSLVGSAFPAIALIKVLVFWVGITGFFSCVAAIRQKQIDTTEWYVSLCVSVVLLSVLSLALGQGNNFRGESVNVSFYNLAFYHSQTAGSIFALLMIYLYCVLLFASHRNRWICVPLLGFMMLAMYLTRSRTGAGTLIFGVGLATLLALLWGRGRRFAVRLNYSRGAILAGGLVAVLGLAVYDVGTDGGLSSAARSYLVKSGADPDQTSWERIVASRMGKVESSWDNFKQSPLVGIGFGISKEARFVETATILYAPVEKGFLPTALLEEVGLVGTAVFVVFALTMLGSLMQTRNIPGTAMFAAFLVSNLGEAAIFALGGHASFMWLFVIGGILLGDRCKTAVPSRRWNRPESAAESTHAAYPASEPPGSLAAGFGSAAVRG